MTAITRLLDDVRRGDDGAEQRLVGLVYDELRKLARREMVAERADHTLEPTALAHEAYLRLLAGAEPASFENRAHFFSAAASAIRRLLVEHARRRGRLRRGGDRKREDLGEDFGDPSDPERGARVLELNDALERLAAFDADKARLVELRFFAGMTVEEVALARGVSESTVARDWRLARAWLHGELGGAAIGGS
jgi:RNA polymerase sigma factor (TIGR02999 family)